MHYVLGYWNKRNRLTHFLINTIKNEMQISAQPLKLIWQSHEAHGS